MLSLDSSKNAITNISLYFENITKNIFGDKRYVQLMNLLDSSDNTYKYTYCLFTDANLLTTNLFMPVFHTMYMGSSHNNIVLQSEDDFWIPKMFPNNKYYYLSETDNLPESLEGLGISIIQNISQIGVQ